MGQAWELNSWKQDKEPCLHLGLDHGSMGPNQALGTTGHLFSTHGDLGASLKPGSVRSDVLEGGLNMSYNCSLVLGWACYLDPLGWVWF